MIGLMENTLYKGKFNLDDSASARFMEKGSSIKVKFKGTRIAAVIESSNEEYLKVVVDGQVVNNNLNINRRKLYMLAEGLEDQEHLVEIVKQTECLNEATEFYGFELFEGELLTIDGNE